MSELIYLRCDKIDSHPDNPRKNLGDLSELIQSIKTNGILQNLTVVKWFSAITKEQDTKVKDRYRVIIGHRRLAAAKAAGLKEVPCVISDMDYKTQLTTMLAENMQRSDLTVYEQAKGVQQLLDLGESVLSISEKTGFSESTIRRRTKLLCFDEDKFKDSVIRGASLFDLEEIESIDDENDRNILLDAVGTNNFQNELRRAKDDMAKRKLKQKWISFLDTFASPIDKGQNLSGYDVVCTFDAKKFDEAKKPLYPGEMFYSYSPYYIYIYKKEQICIDDDEDAEADEFQRLKEQRSGELSDLSKRFYSLRRDFVKGICESRIDKDLLIESLLKYQTSSLYLYLNKDTYAKMLSDFNVKKKELARRLLIAIWNMFSDGEGNGCHESWSLRHRENKKLYEIYDLFEKLGYETSDEERQYLDGTHALFERIGQ